MSQDHRRQASLGQEKALVAASYIKINLKGLNIIKGGKGKFINVKNTQISGHKISMKLPGVNAPVLLNVENVQNLIVGEDVVTYTGHVADDSNDFFTLSISDDGVMAKINYGKYLYVITPLIGNASKHSIAQLDKSLIFSATDDVIEDKNEKINKNHVEKAVNGSGRVDILFYYASDVNSPSLSVSSIVSEMNAAFARSGVISSNTIQSVGVLPLATTFAGQCNQAIMNDEMKLRHGVFSNIDQEMINYGADLAFTISGDNSASNCYTGLPGRVYGWAPLLDSINPFAIAPQAYVMSNLTALHEIGHSFGGKHSNTTAWPTAASGYTFTVNGMQKQTIMGAYDTSPCVFTGLASTCERIPYFSNPTINYNNIPNVPVGSSDHYMFTYLNMYMPHVSGYRGSPIPPPNSPNPISANNEHCYGLNTINWTAQAGATEYKLYRSNSSSFSYPVLQYTGSNTNTMVNVPNGTWYLRTKACSSSGCSAYSNQVSAYRFNGCL